MRLAKFSIATVTSLLLLVVPLPRITAEKTDDEQLVAAAKASETYQIKDYWPLDVGNKWVHVYYAQIGEDQVLTKLGHAIEITAIGVNDAGNKTWTLTFQSLDANGDVTTQFPVQFFNAGRFRWLSFPVMQREIPRRITVARDGGLQTYCMTRDNHSCAESIFTAEGTLAEIIDPDWLATRTVEHGFDVSTLYSGDTLIGTFEYDDSIIAPPGKPKYIFKRGVGPVVMYNYLLQYARVKGVETTFFDY